MAASRSLQATQDGVNQIQKALTTQKLSHEQLAISADNAARSTAINFCTGKAVDRKYFVKFCEILKLDWQVIAGKISTEQANASQSVDIDSLVQNSRTAVSADIKNRCGTMRVLDMTYPIDASAISTEVNILEKVVSKTRAEIDQLMQGCGPENFDRFFLGNIRQKRINGLEAIDRHNLLMILGKPGAGKTTFLKRLAMMCCEGEKFADRVPVFVTLKEFADSTDRTGLLNFIGQAESMPQILAEGRGLVLLDGLDEVQEEAHDWVIAEIRDFARRYNQNIIIATCRIAAREYIFEQFTEVEVADFNQEQIADFAKKWFQRKNPQQTALFLERLELSKPVKELATNPLLLTLLCLEFEESSDFPASRAELYQRGLNVLLTKWDGTRGIKRDVVYKKLSTKRKESLLGQLAMATFERGDYFFKQAVAEKQISLYIQNLPDASTDPEALQVDSHAVLKSIESQHGLLAERARDIYSFSHLTFQEYFTAKHLVEQPEQVWTRLSHYMTEKRWREVFLLTTEQLEPADTLLLGLKTKTDALLQADEKLQNFLVWVHTKSTSVQSHYKPAAMRAFYFGLACDRAFDLDLDRAFDRDLAFARKLALDLDLDLALTLDRALTLALDRARTRALTLALDRARTLALDRARDRALDRARDRAHNLDFAHDRARKLAHDLDFAHDRALAHYRALALARNRYSELKQPLQAFREALGNALENRENFGSWWQSNGQRWTEQLRQAMITHRNIGHDWQFTDEQKQKLQQYYEANQLLVDCLNSECYVSLSVREEIEATLLLPIAEIEKWKQRYTAGRINC